MKAKKKTRTKKPTRSVRQLEFVRHYVAGEEGIRGNAMASYIAAGYGSVGNSASTNAITLLHQPAIQAEIAAFRAKADERAVRKLVPWVELIPEAQQTLVDAAAGRILDGAGTRIIAADKILDRAMGKPPAKLQVSGRSIDDELDALDSGST